MCVHMYDMQDALMLSALKPSIGIRSVSLLGKLHTKLCYTCMFVCALQIIYIYIKSI